MDPKNRAKLMINKLSSKDQNFATQLKSLTSWDNSSNEEINSIVKNIIDEVIKNGVKVPKGFVYASNTNSEWMTKLDLKKWIDRHKNHIGKI